MAGLGSNGGSDDEEQNAADTKDASDQFPLVNRLALSLHLAFELDEPFLVLITAVEPACLDLRTGHKQTAEEGENEMMNLHVTEGG